MGENGSNGGHIRENALVHLTPELEEAHIPVVLYSYMTGKNLPEEYRGIDKYISEVRKQLIEGAGGELTQLQTIVLDGICEVLLVIKFISAFMGQAPEETIINFERLGVPKISDLAVRGLGNFHTILDKKIKQFHEMTEEQKHALSPQEIHRRAVMGEHIPTGRPKSGDKRNLRHG